MENILPGKRHAVAAVALAAAGALWACSTVAQPAAPAGAAAPAAAAPAASAPAAAAPAAGHEGHAAAAAAATTSASPEDMAKAKATFESVCSGCHESSLATDLRNTRRGWEQVIDRMFGFGMAASDEQVKQIIDYLAATYPPAQ